MVALTPWSTRGQLPNFAPSDDADRAARVYDEDTRHWLAVIAGRHDPAGCCGAAKWCGSWSDFRAKTIADHTIWSTTHGPGNLVFTRRGVEQLGSSLGS